jgi:hypothetical protein
MLRETTRPKAVPCAACGADSMVGVWGHQLCHSCHAGWAQDERTAPGTVYGSVRVDFRAPEAAGDFEKVCAEYRRRTAEWVRESRRAAP